MMVADKVAKWQSFDDYHKKINKIKATAVAGTESVCAAVSDGCDGVAA